MSRSVRSSRLNTTLLTPTSCVSFQSMNSITVSQYIDAKHGAVMFTHEIAIQGAPAFASSNSFLEIFANDTRSMGVSGFALKLRDEKFVSISILL